MIGTSGDREEDSGEEERALRRPVLFTRVFTASSESSSSSDEEAEPDNESSKPGATGSDPPP